MAESETGGEEGEFNIARRTRSHLRIDDFVLNDNLDFPDVDKNLYHDPDSEGDTEYKNFLYQCYSTAEIGGDTNTDDNDPAYVYNDDIFSHGWRFNLDEELHPDETEDQKTINSQQPDVSTNDQNQTLPIINDISTAAAARTTTLPATEFKSPNKAHRRRIDMFDDPEFARILNQQLRQHIQLLTQTYLLTKNTTNMRNEADEAKSHLNAYMKIFKHKSKPSNLLPAMELVNNLATPKDIKSSIRLSWRPLPVPESVKTIISNNPNVFIYPSLLPQVAFSFLPEKLAPKKPKINFTLNEDKLLAYALHEFKGESSQYAFIASLLMTAKTKTQISNHIKNIKRSPGNEKNPIKLYFAHGILPEIDLDCDADLRTIKIQDITTCSGDTVTTEQEKDKEEEGNESKESVEEHVDMEPDLRQQTVDHHSILYQDHDDIMNMDLDDLMAASTTISKSAMTNATHNNNGNNSENSKTIKNLKLRKSMLNLMSHKFLLSQDMGDLIISEFLRASQSSLSERNFLHLLQLLTDLMKKEVKEDDNAVVGVYQSITKFLAKINAPPELHERVVLFLDLDQATKCGCALSYLHWMRFFEFMQHVELYHDGEALEKKLVRLIDALQRDDAHKIKLATANLVNKHPLLKREFESLSLDGKPHQSLFICEEDFDDVTEPISMLNDTTSTDNKNKTTTSSSIYNYEHFNSKVTKEEISYASQSCPCKCHAEQNSDGGQLGQHCGKCNLKFMKGRMYLVNKIKPILAEWSYTSTPPESPIKTSTPCGKGPAEWTFEEDKEILEFCRAKAEQNDETVSFDTSTFEELVNKRRASSNGSSIGSCKKSAREIAERFNQLMEMYKDENSNGVV